MKNLEEILPEVKNWAEEIGRIQLVKSEGGNFSVNTKSSNIDLVTEVDSLSEELIINKIEENFPEHSILGEEGGEIDRESDYTWIIDPLDGTNNYANGYPFFSVSIALKYKEEIVLGVVFAPKVNEMFSAVKGKGAYLNGKKKKVADKDSLENSLLVTGFPYDKFTSTYNNVAHFNKIVMKARGIRRSGSAAYDLCNVAAGRLDGLWEFKLNPWDIAAGKLFVKEAGGKVIEETWDGVPLIVAGNEEISNKLLSNLKEVEL